MSIRTVRTIIQEAAAKEGLDPSYAEQLHNIFESKGIDLQSDGSAFERAIAETCALQASMAATETRTAEAMKKLDLAFKEITTSWREIVSHLRNIHKTVSMQRDRERAAATFQGIAWPSLMRH